jgi:hypothetical protein
MSYLRSSMTTRGELLSDITLTNKLLLGRYLVGFNDVTHVRQTPDLPNHLSWILGHLALTMNRIAEKLDGQPLPEKDFVKADGFGGSRDKGRFDTEAVSFGSKPEERHDRFPSLARSTEIFNHACDRLAAAVRACPDSKLDELTPWVVGQPLPLWALVARMTFHNGFHTGQIADLRRALGFKPALS